MHIPIEKWKKIKQKTKHKKQPSRIVFLLEKSVYCYCSMSKSSGIMDFHYGPRPTLMLFLKSNLVDRNSNITKNVTIDHSEI